MSASRKLDPVTMRDVPTNLSCEPPYPEIETVALILAAPDWTIHRVYADCSQDWPHLISECGMFAVDPGGLEP